MAKKQRDESIYQRLVRLSQLNAKAFDRRETKAGDATARPLTEVARLLAELTSAEQALKEPLIDVATRVVAEGTKVRNELARKLDALKHERMDVEKRRQEFARVAENWDWKVAHRERRDHVGPFTLEHDPDKTQIKLGNCKLAVLRCPSGEEIFGTVKLERARLEREAGTAWGRVKMATLAEQGDSSLPWAKLKAALDSKETPFKKHEAAVLFALALAREGLMEAGATLQTKPPALSQQKGAISLPRITQPGNADRVHALRIEQQPAAT